MAKATWIAHPVYRTVLVRRGFNCLASPARGPRNRTVRAQPTARTDYCSGVQRLAEGRLTVRPQLHSQRQKAPQQPPGSPHSKKLGLTRCAVVQLNSGPSLFSAVSKTKIELHPRPALPWKTGGKRQSPTHQSGHDTISEKSTQVGKFPQPIQCGKSVKPPPQNPK
jgi:hypothetical protein